MNIIEKDVAPLIRIGYWNFLDRYSKIAGPLLEFFKGNDIDVFFRIIDKLHDSIDIEEPPYSLFDIDISIKIKAGIWPDDENKFEYAEGNGIELLEEDKGYFKLHIASADTSSFDPGHYWMYLYFTLPDGSKRTVIRDFIEILE